MRGCPAGALRRRGYIGQALLGSIEPKFISPAPPRLCGEPLRGLGEGSEVLENMNPQRDGLGDVAEIGIQADEFRVVMKGEGGDDQVERAGGMPFFPTATAQIGGVAPECRWRGKQREGGEPGFELTSFGLRGMAKHFKGDRLAEAGALVPQPGKNRLLERGRGFGTGEIHPN